jgi:hypothetical protein
MEWFMQQIIVLEIIVGSIFVLLAGIVHAAGK